MNADNENIHWPVNWSAVVVGGLAGLAASAIAALICVAIGTEIVGHGEHVVSWSKVRFGGILGAVCSAFFSLSSAAG